MTSSQHVGRTHGFHAHDCRIGTHFGGATVAFARLAVHQVNQGSVRLHEFLVVPAFVDDRPDHALDEGGVGAGQYGQPLVRLRRRSREARIHRDNVGTGLLGVHQHARPDDAALQRVVSQFDDGRGLRHLPDGAVRAVTERAERGCRAVGLASVKAPVPAAIGMQQAGDELEVDAGLGGLADEHRPLAVFLLRLFDRVGDGLDGLVPADGLKLSLAALADTLQGGLQAVLRVNVLHFGNAAQTDGLMALFGQVARLDERNALITDGAFQVASGQAVELVAQMSDALLRFGVGRRRGQASHRPRSCWQRRQAQRPLQPRQRP